MGPYPPRPLAQHVTQLLAFCEQTVSTLPAFDSIVILDTSRPEVRAAPGTPNAWYLGRDALQPVSDFAPRFAELLVAGYSWINLSLYGVANRHIVVGIELPNYNASAPPGWTSVNYSGPPRGSTPDSTWPLQLLFHP